MANFLALLDGDTLRRHRVIEAARGLIAPVPGLRTDALGFGELDVVWAAGSRAPVSTARTGSCAAVIWGEAIPGPGPARLDAAGLLRAWAPGAGSIPEPCDGFYAALRFDLSGHLTIGADLLGLFPVYYASRDGVLIAGSSPELFGLHPLFPARLAPEGLIGLLLTHGPLEGCALLEGVRRLAPGCLLRLRPERHQPEEGLQYAMRATDEPGDSFEQHVERLEAAHVAALERQVPGGEEVGFLLSGGHDSRLLAGYLDRRGIHPPALTFGAPRDYELRSAAAVARALGLVHHLAEVPFEGYPAAAQVQARWEHLGTGFSSIHTWCQIAPLHRLPARFVTGYMFECREVEPVPSSFASFRAFGRSHGFPLELLRRLLRAGSHRELANQLYARLEEVFNAPAAAGERGWRFLLAHDFRSHSGGAAWRLSFGSWPVLPILDRNLLDTVATLPDSSLADRRAQVHLIRTRFPRLARLPLDRNAAAPMPIAPSLLWRARGIARAFAQRLPRVLSGRGAAPPSLERRHYYRVYDINNPGWQAIRRLAEPHREALTTFFDPATLAELLPPPPQRIGLGPLTVPTFWPKLLLGLMLWFGRGNGSVPTEQR